MDANAKTPNTPSPSPTPATKTPRTPRRIVTYTILGGAVLTLIAVLGVQRQSRAVASQPGPKPVGVMPLPRAPEPPDPLAQTPAPRVELVFDERADRGREEEDLEPR
jgi:hypothetical protein